MCPFGSTVAHGLKIISNMRKEIWKGIRGYIGLYDVSNFCRIRSLKHGKVRILKPFKEKDGYLHVELYKNRKGKKFYVHRLVWEAFNGAIPEGMQVNHINEDKTDNRLENLNLMTPKENMNWGTANQRRADKLKNNINSSQTVLQLTYPGLEFMCEWPSTAEAGRNGFSQSAVSDCCLGKRKSHKGVTFRYKETYSV